MISNFPTKKLTNLGGLRSFKFIPAYLVASYPPLTSEGITSTLRLLHAQSWLNGYATPETLDFVEESRDSENGVFYSQKISGFVPGDSQDLSSLMAEMNGLPFVIQLTNPKNETKLIGISGYPLTFSSKFVSGTTRADSKGYQFEFSGESLLSAPAYII